MSLPREFLYELHRRFTGEIRTDPASRILYSTDASIYQIEPLGVIVPRTQEDLHAAIELAVKYRVPILPRGAGTSLAGQVVGEALILDCSRWLDNIIEIDAEEGHAVVEPGVILSDLNAAAANYGLMYGPDPASAERATMGGVIANNATGAHSIVYGMSADHLLSADVILGDGSLETWREGTISKLSGTAARISEHFSVSIKRGWTQTWRNSAGYRLNYLIPWSPSKPTRWEGAYPPVAGLNLAPLLAGSEGTLGVIRRMRVRLVRKPENTALAVISYGSVAEACDDVPRLLAYHPSAIELIPRTILQAARSSPGYSSEMTWLNADPAALLVVEFAGILDGVSKIGASVLIASSKEDQQKVWNVRKVGLGLMDSKPGSKHPVAFIEDCAVPVERLGEFVREVEKILAGHGVEGGMYAHASAGCLHIRPILDLKTSKGVTDLRSISEAVFALTMSLGGAMSSEHGDGLARSEYVAGAYGPEIMDAMRLLKNAADPHGLLNPGKIIGSPKMDEHLRYGTDYQTLPWQPSLSFHGEGSLDLAVEQCNGQGVCRKSSGVMCPSYQATREEMHSTRGRANLLRALIGRPKTTDHGRWSGIDGLSSAVFEALDLCLACKGCKAECPSGVDMAKLKFEFENEYYKTHRRPLRDYLFAYFHVVAGTLARVAPLANAMMQIPLTRRVISKSLGLAEKRPFPRIAARAVVSTDTLAASAGLRRDEAAPTRPPEIIFLPDVFSRYVEPRVKQAALGVLQACGFRVRVMPIIGAGASFLSKGFIEAARRHARKTLEMLNRIDPKGEAIIVGLEPPEVYLLKHDYIDLLPARDGELRSLMDRVWLIDEFLVRSKEFESVLASLTTKRGSGRIFFHPHCHQRAEGLALDGFPSGAQAGLELLRLCGYRVELSGAGCCGMAGTFGYEQEHYDLSMKIGELRLLPRVREWMAHSQESGGNVGPMTRDEGPSSTVFRPLSIVSTGASCRMQIRHGASVEARHPIEAVRDALLDTH